MSITLPNLTNVQAYFASMLNANSKLAALMANGQPYTYDPTADQETKKAAVGNALTTYGVFLEIGFPYGSSDNESFLDGTTRMNVLTPLDVLEDCKRAHTPLGLPLVNEVLLACTARPNATQKPARLMRLDHTSTELGYVLHQFIFSIPILVKQSSG